MLLQQSIKNFTVSPVEINTERKALLEKIASFITDKLHKGEAVKMNFICTENSRRSHISQLLAAALANHFNLPIQTFSGGTKATACNPRTIAAMRRAGFIIADGEGENPHYEVRLSEEAIPMYAYSKVYDAPENPQDNFIAIMVCGHADENCPYIPTAERRFAVTFDDPKVSDNTPEEAATYDARVHEIGSQFYYLFDKVKA